MERSCWFRLVNSGALNWAWPRDVRGSAPSANIIPGATLAILEGNDLQYERAVRKIEYRLGLQESGEGRKGLFYLEKTRFYSYCCPSPYSAIPISKQHFQRQTRHHGDFPS